MAIPINIEDLLNKRKIESNRIEFKKGWNPDKIYRTICAFANDFDNIGGGYIVVGVEEEEQTGIAKRPVAGLPIEGLNDIQKDMVWLTGHLLMKEETSILRFRTSLRHWYWIIFRQWAVVWQMTLKANHL